MSERPVATQLNSIETAQSVLCERLDGLATHMTNLCKGLVVMIEVADKAQNERLDKLGLAVEGLQYGISGVIGCHSEIMAKLDEMNKRESRNEGRLALLEARLPKSGRGKKGRKAA